MIGQAIVSATELPTCVLSWSSGKDSAWALQVLREQRNVDVAALVTTFDPAMDGVAMHGVPLSLVREQAEAAGLPLWEIPLPWGSSNDVYEAALTSIVERARSQHLSQIAFGDLHLADIRQYREQQLAGSGLTATFPLWSDTAETTMLAQTMQRKGLKARVTCVDTSQVPASFLGRDFDPDFLVDLPEAVDACGERGEFHTLCYDGPMYSRPIRFTEGHEKSQGPLRWLTVAAVRSSPSGSVRPPL